MTVPPPKICASCGREFAWRAKWRANWDEVRYCSQACRRRRISDLDRRVEEALRVALAAHREVDPAEVTRSLDADVEPEAVRRAARRLVAEGAAQLTQRGRVVDPSTARGPFRLRRA